MNANSTRLELETDLSSKICNRVISYVKPNEEIITGKIDKVAIETKDGEHIVIFQMNSLRYESDLQYFIENIIIHGNSSDTGN